MKKITELLYEYLSDPSNLDPEEFYQNQLPEVVFNDKENANSWCPFHNPLGSEGGQTPSLSVNRVDGTFKCHSCQAGGKNVVQFWQIRYKTSFNDTLEQVFSTFIHPIIRPALVRYYHENLLANTRLVNLILEKRGISLRTLKLYEVGFDGERVVLPIKNEFGFYINARRWDYTGTSRQKMLNYQQGYGCVKIYPLQAAHNNPITLVEGEWDALLANQLGIPAVTVTGGVGSWDDDLNSVLKGKDVRICFDVNDKRNTGQICARERAKLLVGIAASVKIIELPLTEVGGDITDFFHKHHHTKQEWDALVEKSDFVSGDNAPIISTTSVQESEGPASTTLGAASEAKFIKKAVRFSAVVQGKDAAPYAIPHEVSITCPPDDDLRCEACPNKGLLLAEEKSIFEVAPDVVSLPDYIFKSTKDVDALIKSRCGHPKDCKRSKLEHRKFRNVEQVILAPDTLYAEERTEHVSSDGYYIGHGLKIGATYDCSVYPVQHPKNQKVIYLVESVKPVQASFETFTVTPKVVEDLSVFETDDPLTKMAEIYDHYAINGTRIFGRPDLHMALDLPFFSALSFPFCGELIHKGWADVLIIGDAQSGKGKISTWLTKFYRIGEIASAENTSKAGLVGGVAQYDTRNVPTFGKVVTNNGKLLILDELSSLNNEIIKDMSRVRSEGIAEIVKIVTASAQARTRLIMIGNTKSGRPLSKYNFGVEAIRELIESSEDIARFDYAYGVSEDEVSSEAINKRQPARLASPYTAEKSRMLIQWVWSRTPSQVVFRRSAEDLILSEAIRLGKKYSAEIPLVQPSNIRIKLAKISVMCAARVFSHTARADKILVRDCDVEACIRFLEEKCYDTRSLAYHQFSEGQNDEHMVDDSKAVIKLIDDLEHKAERFVEALIKRRTISLTDIQDYSGHDRSLAESLKGKLVRHRCLFNCGDKYVKTAGFTKLLKQQKQQYEIHGVPKKRSF